MGRLGWRSLAPVDGDDFYGVGDAFEGDFAGLGDGPVAVGGGLAADEDLAGAGEGACVPGRRYASSTVLTITSTSRSMYFCPASAEARRGSPKTPFAATV